MASVKLSSRALSHLEGIFEFVAENDPERALATVLEIREAIMMLERHPLLGREVEYGRRELIISHGRNAYLALYRWWPADDTVLVLAIRHARQAGYSGD